MSVHRFIGDTFDGELADHLRVLNGVWLPRYKDAIGSDVVPFPWKSGALDERENAESIERILPVSF